MNHAAILQVIGLAALCRLRTPFNQSFLSSTRTCCRPTIAAVGAADGLP